MKHIQQIYIDGKFVHPHGTETLNLINPTNQKVIGRVTLADEEDAKLAISAAKKAFTWYSNTSLKERGEYLTRLHDSVKAREKDLLDVMVEEYGGPVQFSQAAVQRTISSFLQAKATMEKFEFVRSIGQAQIHMKPLGVVGLITPWNANNSFIASKLSMSLASGSTAVLKPSEMSALQTQVMTEALHAADLPPGLFNIVTGRGDIVGAEITRNPDIAKISFTGSTVVGKTIARGAVDTLKRVTLELGGKSPNIILDDADFEKAIPLAINIAFMNSGQACIAGSRLLIPESRLEEAKKLIVKAIESVRTGTPRSPETQIGPMVSVKQYERVQSYIQSGIDEGAELLIGGLHQPEGLENGNFVKPTAFVARPDMRIAREEIFGPVLSVMTYKSEEEAIRLANDTVYGLHGYVSSGSAERGALVASQIVAGRVFVNGMYDEPLAPFGGFKQSGLGREFGSFGLEAYLEPKTFIGPR
ncbi:MAG TPA: aldehyde dehydrogenase family protein [Bdellovibrio sp.]|uniref:aldehyde dehydrogenase family protein n=1 Tax=Bdellovibrio sp. TaxID=28201 RepID=UPI002EF27648